MDLISALNWRYAAKHLTDQPLARPQIERLLDAVRLSPSSYGLQPYVATLVESPELLAAIHQQAAPQPQVSECSHLLVFSVLRTLDDALVDRFIDRVAEQRQMPHSDLAGYADAIKGTVNGFASDQQRQDWAARQAYIALGVLLTAAALEGVDAAPMEGFDPGALDRVLGLEAEGLRSVVIVGLGHRDKVRDPMATAAKVRWPVAELIQRR